MSKIAINKNSDLFMKHHHKIFIIIYIYFSPAYAFAANGLISIGFGSESIAMGGADQAVTHDINSLNINPAGISAIKNDTAKFDFILFNVLNGRHADQFGNNSEPDKDLFAFGLAGYATKLSDSPYTLGVAVFLQGGIGVEHSQIRTVYGTTDNMTNLLSNIRVNTGFSREVSDDTSIGVTLVLTQAESEQELFPNTSFFDSGNPASAFFGFHIARARATGIGFKLGIQHELNNDTSLGLTYTSPIQMNFKNGYMVSNQSSIGLGKVRYNNVSIHGFDAPEEVRAGIKFKPAENLTLAFDLAWLNWSKSLDTVTVHATLPDNPSAQPNITTNSNLNWQNQYVYALGLQYQYNHNLQLHAGYNYGNNPVPTNATTPLTSAITEQHITAGFSYQFDKHWQHKFALQYALPHKVTYTNNSLPFGQNSTLEFETLTLYYETIYTW